MDWTLYLQSLGGGAMIGLAASLYLLVNGRIAGISGIVGGIVAPGPGRSEGVLVERAAFALGLPAGVAVFALIFGAWPQARFDTTLPVLAVAGLLVGFGSLLGSGCTSGHGVCGLARLSRRSLAATATFFAVAALTVFAMEHVL